MKHIYSSQSSFAPHSRMGPTRCTPVQHLNLEMDIINFGRRKLAGIGWSGFFKIHGIQERQYMCRMSAAWEAHLLESYQVPTTTMFNMRSTRAKLSILYSLIGFFVLVKLWITGSGIDTTTWSDTFLHRHDLPNDLSTAAQNETLGFEKIFYISMPQYSTICSY